MVGNVTIQGQIVGTATFDGAKISAVVTITPPINATVVFGRSGVTVHNELTGRDAVDAHPKESITDLTIADSPEFANTQITTLDSVANGGIIPNSEATWLGATAKNVLSYLQKLVSKVYAINSRVAVLENNLIFDFTTTIDTTSFIIDKDNNGNNLNLTDGNYTLIRISHNGNNNLISNASSFSINDISVLSFNQYYIPNNLAFNGINYLGGAYFSRVEISITIKNGSLGWSIVGFGMNNSSTATVFVSSGNSFSSVNIPSVYKLTVMDQNRTVLIKAGTQFILYKNN